METENRATITLVIKCRLCGKLFEITVNTDDWLDFKFGRGHIQDIFPYLTAAERELILSNTCDDCFTKLFSEED